MARTLDPDVLVEKDEQAASPALVLRLDLPSPAGTRYYSDRTLSVPGLEIEPRIVEGGRILRELSAGRRPSVADARFALRDEDGALRALLSDVELQGSRATVYQYFEGLAASTMTPLLAGVASGPVEYREERGALAFDVTDISRKWALDIGSPADGATFPEVDPRDEGRMLPVVFGRVRRARGVCVRSGRRGVLLRDCTPDDTTLYVSGFEDLPAGTALTIEIGRERITGTISGAAFSVSQRGGGTIASGVVTHETGRQNAIRDENLPGVDNEYVGYFLKVWVSGSYDPQDIPYTYRCGGGAQIVNPPSSGYEYRPIQRYDASTGTIEYWPPFTVEGTRSETPSFTIYGLGSVKLIHIGSAYEITTIPAFHRSSDRVTEVVESGWSYIVNDAPSVRVDAVYLYGRRRIEPVLEPQPTLVLGGGVIGVLGSEELGQEDPPLSEPDWVPIPPELYSVDLCDTTSFPALGRALTTVTFRRSPLSLPGHSILRTELRADVLGVESAGDGSGTLVENPAEAIRTLLVRWGGMDAEADIDGAAFDEAASRLARVRFALALDEVRALPTVAAELAFQARAALLWREARASIRVLPWGAGSPDHALDFDDRIEAGLMLSWDDEEDLATVVAASFVEAGEEREVVVRDSDAVAAWGARTRRCRMWAYGEARFVEDAARFWLSRWSAIRRRARVSTFLQSLAVEPGDVVAVSSDEIGPGTYNAEVRSVRHRPGSGRDSRMDRIEMELRLPLFAGCESSCELSCETGCESACEAGCESACESSCELSCEAACQNVCELDCAAAAECLCQDACMVAACEVGCEVLVTGLDGWDCGACETACQVACEATCEAVCEAVCESSCEVSCESACESGCESACESTCESACESACETGAES